MASGDIQDLLGRYGRGRGPTELSRDSRGQVTPQSVHTYMTGTAEHLRLPSPKVIMGISDALNFRDDTEVLLAFGRSVGLRLGTKSALVVTAMPAGVEKLNAYPDLVADIHRQIESLVRTLADQPRSTRQHPRPSATRQQTG